MTEDDFVRHDGKTVGKITTKRGRKFFIWFQNPLRFFGQNGGFSMSEGLLRKLPTDVETFIVKTSDNKKYVYTRQQFETGEKIPIYDDRFNETPPEPQYAVEKESAVKFVAP